MASKIIIDTDPLSTERRPESFIRADRILRGVDDLLALLLALSSNAKSIDLLLISCTFGNVSVDRCLHNLLSMFSVIESEQDYRTKHGRPAGFDSIVPPILAVGAGSPLEGQEIMADHFHGIDGIQGVHTSHPHYSAKHVFDSYFATPGTKLPRSYTPSREASASLIHKLLLEYPPNTITIITLGPLTTLSQVTLFQPSVLHRAKAIIAMGGALDVPGNITPVAEFNVFADVHAAAHIFSLASQHPAKLLPATFPERFPALAHSIGPNSSPIPIPLTILPLDLTSKHVLTGEVVEAQLAPRAAHGSPLAEWTLAILRATMTKISGLSKGPQALECHDPLCVWFVLALGGGLGEEKGEEKWDHKEIDVRVETEGLWTSGQCVVDRRQRRKAKKGETIKADHGKWLGYGDGTRVRVVTRSGWEDTFGEEMLKMIFAL